MKFFDLIYYMKKQFSSLKELTDAHTKSEEIENSKTKKEARTKFGQYIIQNNILNDELLSSAIKYFEEPSNGGQYKTLNDYVQNDVYKKIADIDLPNDTNRYEGYRYFLTQMKDSDGRFLTPGFVPKENEIDEEKNSIDDNAVTDFLTEFNILKNLKEDERDLYHLIYFVYATRIEKYDYSKINRQEYRNDIPNDLQIIIPILEHMSQEYIIQSKMMKSFYRVFIDTDKYDTDAKYVSAIDSENKKSKVVTDYDFNRILVMSENISKVLKDESFFVDSINDIISDSEKFVNSKSYKDDEGTDAFDGKMSLEEAIIKYINSDGSIKDAKKAEKTINDTISEFVKEAAKKMSAKEQIILDYKDLMTNTFVINTYKGKRGQPETDGTGIIITMEDAISKWNAFLKTPMYRTGFGDKLVNDIKAKIIDDTFVEQNYKKFKYFKKDKCKDVINIIEVVNTKNSEEIAYSCKNFLKSNAMSDTNSRFDAAYEILKWLKLFFEVPFANDVSMDKSKLTGQYYDAACQLVYYQDKNVKESYNPDKSIMLFEKVVLFEAHDWTKYFNKLSDVFMNFFGDKKSIDVLQYIKSGSLIKPGKGILPEKPQEEENTEEKSQENNVENEVKNKTEETVKLAADAAKETEKQADAASKIVSSEEEKESSSKSVNNTKTTVDNVNTSEDPTAGSQPNLGRGIK